MNIKTIITAAGMSLTEVAQYLSEKYGRPYSVQNLNNKIRNRTLRLHEAEDIAEFVGYEIVWKKKLTTEISQHIDKFQNDPEYRRECRKNQAQEIIDMDKEEPSTN